MAKRRMFSLDIVDTDKFLEMPATTQSLYFHLGMRADDDGFISSPKKVTKIVNCSDDDLKILISKGYVIPFESGIVVIRHWNQNNYLRNDRYIQTIYTDELSQLTLNNSTYDIVNPSGIPNDIPNIPNGIPNDIPTVSTGKDRLGKDRLGKDSIDNTICSEPDKSALNPSGILLPLNDKSLYDVPQESIDTWATAYPAVDVIQELHKMRAWLESNPTRRKTKRGINRFINSWLSRTQDSGGTKGQKGVSEQNGNNAYNSDERWNSLKRIIDEVGGNFDQRDDLPFK